MSPSPSELIGRAKECRSLDEVLDAVRAGQSRVLVVRGDAGIGKSALLQRLIARAVGFKVVHADGVESEMELPFAALHQLCTSMFDRLDALPDPQRDAATTAFGLTLGAFPDRLLIGLAALNLLSAAADESPLLCIIDDAHWLDRESAQALAFVARRLLAEPVALVFATRWPVADLGDLPEVVVEGLHDGDAHTLLSAVLHVPVDERVRNRVVAETRGNPLALVEWPRGRSPAELAGGFGMPTMMPMAGQIEESFRRRLAELPIATQRWLTVAAAEPAGDPVIVWRAAGVLGVGARDAAPAIEAGLVDVDVRVRFRHPLVRSAAYRTAALPDRQAAHHALAAATDPDTDPERRAWHRALGSPGPDEDIAAALEQSADRARARGGLAAAAALLERSVALTVDASRRADRILAAAAAHLEAGSFAQGAGLLAAAEATPMDEMRRAQLDLLRARHSSVGGDVRDAPKLLLQAAQRLEPLDLELAASTYMQAMAAACVAGNFARGVALGDVARAAISCLSSATPATSAALVEGLARVTTDGVAAAVPLLQSSLEKTPTETFAAQAFQWLGYQCGAASVLWDSDGMRELSTFQLTAARDVGALTMMPWALNTLANVVVLEGDLEQATTLVAEASQLIEATGGNLLPWAGAVLAGWRGDADALRVIDDIISTAQVAGNGLALKNAQWARACLCNATGKYDEAMAVALEADRQPWEWGAQNFFHELVEAAVRCGRPDVAAPVLERLVATAEPTGSNWGLGLCARSRALLASGTDADQLYDEAIAVLSRSKIRPELARAHLLYGEWLRRENRRVDARGHLRTAYDMFTAMGVRGFAERTWRELLATGETVRKRTVDSFDELTAQEATIARLAADGRTNPEIGAQLFISARTVEWHLRKVFTKLDVTSRRALRDALSRQGRLTQIG